MFLKKENTIGCCGIDCGLCPRFHTNGASACPGCCSKDFKEKHPTCGFVTCCVIKRGMETCADCNEFPCYRFENEKSGFDSFVTHKKVFPNLGFIKMNGTALFVSQQRIRMELLKELLEQCDDGRSKSFFCLSCALLPIDTLRDCHRYMEMMDVEIDIKEKNKLLKEYIQLKAKDLQINLTLNKKN